MNKLKNFKNKNGITLIALVITIIVLLILAAISITMLTGDNNILKRAADAKIQAEIGQEKEIVALAYNSTLAKKISNGDSTAVTAGDLNNELTNQGATASGSNPIRVRFNESKRQYNINTNGEITYAGIKNDDDNNIQLSINATQTESRAVILKVIATKEGEEIEENILTEAKLQKIEENNPEQVQEMFVEAYKPLLKEIGAPDSYIETITWSSLTNNAESVASLNNDSNFIDFISSKGYSSAYDIILKNNKGESGGLIATFTCTGNEPVTGTSAEFIVTKPNPVITVTLSDNGEHIEKVWHDYPTEKIETYSEIKNSNYTLTQDEYTAIIPAGFAYGKSSNVGTIKNGLVITDAVDENGYSIGNEFVWIPVDKEKLTVAKTEKKIARVLGGNKGGIDSNGNTIYKGIIYSFSNGNSEALVTGDHDESITYYNSVDFKKSVLFFNALIKSCTEYGGYYVARYEIGEDDNFSILGSTPKDANVGSGYGEGEFESIYTNSYNSVHSNMMIECLYDAILNFSLSEGNDSDKVFSTEYGHYKGSPLPVGLNLKEDSINNIFDLAGNMFECCLDLTDFNRMKNRGGSVEKIGDMAGLHECIYPPIHMFYPTTNTKTGTRLILYIV